MSKALIVGTNYKCITCMGLKIGTSSLKFICVSNTYACSVFGYPLCQSSFPSREGFSSCYEAQAETVVGIRVIM